MSDAQNHESWAKSANVIKLLQHMLAFPQVDHSAPVLEVLPDGLRQAHAVSLTRVSSALDFSKAKWKGSTTKNKGVALHIWLYHFMGERAGRAVASRAGECASV